MTRVFKWLGGGGLALALGVLMLTLSGSLTATDVEAQSPPTPPSRFAGKATIDGRAAPLNTVIEARIGGAACGSGTVITAAGDYTIDVLAQEPGATTCGTPGAAITFLIGGRQAQQSGSWNNGVLQTLNLTYVTPTPTPTPTTATATVTTTTPTTGTPGTPGTPGTATTPRTNTPGGGTGGGAAATPRAPSVGNTGVAGDSTALWLFALLGAGALAFGAGGAVVARRSR